MSVDVEVGMVEVDLDISITENQDVYLPEKILLTDWITRALVDSKHHTKCFVLGSSKDDRLGATVSMRIVGETEITELNHKYRQQNNPTNVLSFPFEPLPDVDVNLLGDIVICAKVIQDEARQQSKSNDQHWAHIVVHGVLHLVGYEHEEKLQAEEMELLEIGILSHFGYPNPYGESNVP